MKSSSSHSYRFLPIVAILLLLIGAASLIFSIIDLFHGKAGVEHYDESQGGLKIENPLWPSSGKGFWVGLILMATSLVGFLASREGTRSSMIAFTAMAIVSTILSFYMMITSIIPVRYYSNSGNNGRERWQTNELVLNCLLIAAGVLGTIVGMIASIFGCAYASCCIDQRVTSFYPADANPAVPDTPMKYPQGNVPHMPYSHHQPTYRMAM